MELTKGMRQSSYPKFQTALDNLADLCCTEDDIELFCSLDDTEDMDTWANDITAIFNLNNALEWKGDCHLDVVEYEASFCAHTSEYIKKAKKRKRQGCIDYF